MIELTMNDGHKIPQVGYGVFLMSPAEVEEHLPQAIQIGYRHVDTANAYFNEKAVGRVVNGSGIPREEFFITSKLFPQSYPYEQCKKDIDATLRRLNMDYLDLLLLHQPYGAYTQAWKAMEEAVAAGKVRSIGLSNFPEHKIQQILDVATIVPAVLQVEINPYWNQAHAREPRHLRLRAGRRRDGRDQQPAPEALLRDSRRAARVRAAAQRLRRPAVGAATGNRIGEPHEQPRLRHHAPAP